MPHCLLILLPPAAALAATLAAPAAAQDTGEADRITVVATGSVTRIAATGQAVSVVDRDTIEQAQGIDLTRALERVPGLGWTRNGGPGGFTAVRLRGADAEQVLVLLDGVRLDDPSAPSGGTDFALLSPHEVGRIEVLRGSNSVPWGSAALGGVIALTGRDVDGAEGHAEYGAHGTLSASGALGISAGRDALTLTAGHARSDGISAAASGTEPDGFSAQQLGLRGRLGLARGLALSAAARLARTRSDIDGYPAPAFTFGDTAEQQATRQAGGQAALGWAGDGVELATSLALSQTRRAYADEAVGEEALYRYRGHAVRWDLRGRLALPQGLALHFGGDREWSRFASTFDAPARATITSGHAMLVREWQGGAATLGLRRDEHDRFGGAWTFGANTALDLAPDLRLRASWGEGFKAPTLFQLLSDYGNAALQPETARSLDLGLQWRGESSGPDLSATLFRRDSRNLIAFVSCASLGACGERPFGLYANVARARSQGLELEARSQVAPGLDVQLSYAFIASANRTPDAVLPGRHLPRRPRHALTLAGDWQAGRLSLGADLRVAGRSFDDAANTRPLAAHALLALRGTWEAGDGLEVYGRIENLLGERYETVAEYATWGRAAFIGVRVRT